MQNDISFFEKVYQVVMLIPKGRATSYGAIAKYLGTAKSARMVGWAMNATKNNLHKVPAYRVVNRNGVLSGKMHFGDTRLMQAALEAEGIKVVNDKIQDWEKVFWNPTIELSDL